MKIAQLFILILAFFVIKPAKAGLLLEPVVGYSSISKFKIGVPDSSTEQGSGPSYGGRIGYQNLGFQLGLDFLRSSYEMEDKDFKDDLVSNEYAGFVGFEFPILFRVYVGYIFAANAETKADDGLGTIEANKFTDGTGMKLGVGFTGLPFIDINLEYRKLTFGEYKAGGVKANVDTDVNTYMISLSLPLVL